MEIFKNGVGRPSNETLQKRRNLKLVIALIVIAAIGAGGYYLYSNNSMKDVKSTNKNTQLANVYAEVFKPDGGDYDYRYDEKGTQYLLEFNAYKTGKFTSKVELKNATGKTVYYKVFSFESGNYKSGAKISKNCTIAKTGTTKFNVSQTLTTSSSEKAIKVKTYATKKLCDADKTSNGATGYSEGTTVAVYRYYNINNKKVLFGDANGDGKVNGLDSELIKKYASGYSVDKINIKNADLHYDGKINSWDYLILLRYLGGKLKPDLYPVILFGDLNRDMKVDINDVNAIKSYLASSNPDQHATADVDGDGKVTQFDLARIRQYIAETDIRSGYQY